MAAGKLSAGEVRINWLCDMMGWDKHKFLLRGADCQSCGYLRATHVYVPINYPDNNAVLDGVDDETYQLCRRIDPYRLHIPLARVLRRLDYQYVVDLCFCAQLIPAVRIGEHRYQGYKIETGYGMLTCSLTALQYVEAQELIEQGDECFRSSLPFSTIPKGVPFRACPRKG